MTEPMGQSGAQLNGGGAERVVNVAVIGLGYWGPNLLRALFEVPGATVSHICDLDEDRLRRYAARYPGVTPTTDPDDILNDPEVDAVVIATPVFSHFGLASRTLEAGKHTLVEKPLAASTNEAQELIRLAERRERVLMCGHTFVYS